MMFGFTMLERSFLTQILINVGLDSESEHILVIELLVCHELSLCGLEQVRVDEGEQKGQWHCKRDKSIKATKFQV